MTVHNYRSRQVHETLNGVNPSSGFRDMRSAKSGSNLWQIWQVFGPWASPYGANGQMSMTVHNYRPRQFHRTSNGENPSSGYRDMGSASLAAARPTARPPGPWRQYPSSPEGWGVKMQSHGRVRNTNRCKKFASWGLVPPPPPPKFCSKTFHRNDTTGTQTKMNLTKHTSLKTRTKLMALWYRRKTLYSKQLLASF